MQTNNIHIKYCKSGIIKVIVNTHTRWCEYNLIHHNNEGSFSINEYDLMDNLMIHDFEVDLVEHKHYTVLQDQEKDQVYIYFIPYSLLDMGE